LRSYKSCHLCPKEIKKYYLYYYLHIALTLRNMAMETYEENIKGKITPSSRVYSL